MPSHKNHWPVLLALILAFSLAGASCIRVATPPGTGVSTWKFAVVTDTQGPNRAPDGHSCVNDSVVQAIANDIVREHPDLVLISGDLVNGWFRNGGTPYPVQYQNWKKAMAPVYRSGIRVYPIRGNHDDGPERLVLPPLPAHLEPPPGSSARLKKAFQEAFAESYIPKNGPVGEEGLTYSFSYQNAFFVGLDQYSGGQHKINQAWLDRQLEGNSLAHVFIYGHEPAFELHHKDNLACFPGLRDTFWDSIGKAGARIYFCGHDHFYDRALIADSRGRPIRQMIGGSAGGKRRTWSGVYREADRITGEYHNDELYGYILVTVAGPDVTVRWKALTHPEDDHSWQVLDTFSYTVRQ